MVDRLSALHNGGIGDLDAPDAAQSLGRAPQRT
jgi:hypothetical protein